MYIRLRSGYCFCCHHHCSCLYHCYSCFHYCCCPRQSDYYRNPRTGGPRCGESEEQQMRTGQEKGRGEQERSSFLIEKDTSRNFTDKHQQSCESWQKTIPSHRKGRAHSEKKKGNGQKGKKENERRWAFGRWLRPIYSLLTVAVAWWTSVNIFLETQWDHQVVVTIKILTKIESDVTYLQWVVPVPEHISPNFKYWQNLIINHLDHLGKWFCSYNSIRHNSCWSGIALQCVHLLSIINV